MKNPIDLSIDPSRGMTGDPQVSPTNARFSRITGIKGATNGGTGGADFSNFCDDSKFMDLLINDANEDEYGQKFFDEIDMGQIDEEER